MKKTLISLLLIMSVIAAGCNQPTAEEANDAFCQSLQAFGEALVDLNSLSATSTVGDLKDATAQMDDAWNATTKSAKELNEVKLDTIDESWKNLRRTVNQVDNDETLAAAATSIGVSVEEIKVSFDQIGEVYCPGLAMVTESQEPADEAQPADLIPAESAPAGFPGTYGVSLMLAGSETNMVLVLNEDSSVFVVMRPVGQTTEIIVSGQWQDNGDGTATVTLTEMQGGQMLATPETISFRLEGDALVAFQFDETVYGADGFTLQRMPDDAVAAEAAAVAQQAGAAMTTTTPLTTAVPLTTTAPATATESALLPADLFGVPGEPAQQASAAITASAPLTTAVPLTATTPTTTTEAAAPLTDQLGVPAEPAAPEAPAEPELAASPLGRVWLLQQIVQTSGVNYTPDDPALYTVTFNADGTLSILADCNTGVGTYQASESGALTINLSATHAYCAAGSLSNQYISYLTVANSYDVQGDVLGIGFSSNNGTMTFAAAP